MQPVNYPNKSVQQAIPVPMGGRTPNGPPKTSSPAIVDQWQYDNPNPGTSRFTPAAVRDPSAKVTQYPGTATAPVNLNDGRYDNSWMAFMGDQPEGGTVGHVGTAQPGAIADDSSWRDRIYADRAAAQGRSSGVSAGPTQRTVQPMEAMKAPDLPEYKGVGEYAPPEEDKGVYNQARREAMGPGMRALREGTREAISSAQSLDNPNARAKFIQESLKGYGQGLESVAAGAAREGRTEARGKRQEQLALYKTNYDIKSDTYLKNYQNQINTIASNFASEQAAQVANYNAGMDPNVNVAGQGGGARDKSTYYPGGY